MVVILNVVQVRAERRAAFERAVLDRQSGLREADGFAGLELLRGTGEEYLVLTRWRTEAAFQDWLLAGLTDLGDREVDVELVENSEVIHCETVGSA